MTSQLNVNPFSTLNRHLENIRASLSQRLEVAKASDNVQLIEVQLIELLKQEKQQITPAPKLPLSAVNSGRNGMLSAIFGRSAPVVEFVNGSDRWWYVTDPQTNTLIYADSEAELRLWLQEHQR